MQENQQLTSSEMAGGDALKEFQLANLSISEKSSKENGILISKKIWGYVLSGLGGYYWNRNARFQKNRNFANGRIDVQAMFQDRFQFNAKQNYIRLVWNTLQIVNRIVSGLVGRWMARGEKVVVQAIDNLSQTQKEEEYAQIEFILEQREKLEKLQAESGIPMMPQDQQIPADKEELNLWKLQFQRIPEEIENELGCNDVLSSNGWYDVLKEKMLHDSAEVGLVGTETWMDEQGVIHVEWVKPENIIYSASDYPDFRDTTWRGQVPDLKISELRRCWGKEFNPNNPLALDEEQLFKVAQTAKEYKSVTNLIWDSTWNTIYLRPYDEWNVRCMKFEIKTVDKEPYTVTKSTISDRTYTQKGYPVNKKGERKSKPSDNQQILDDSNINIYRGVYLPDNDILLEWGIKKNMIRPQDPKEIGNAEFSMSIYMYQNYQMRNLAIPEKIEAAIDNMILACLKMQQVIARMRPTGAAINTDAMQELDFGLGDEGNNKAVDPKRLFDQTGDIYYRGRDAEGNPIPVPIQELANSGFLGQMDGLIRDYQFWYQTLKDELGEDPNAISAALQPRVTSSNVDTSQQLAEYATDYMYKAYAECMKMTSRKISCLLKDSIQYGAKAYRDIVKQPDINNRVFSTDIKFLPTIQQMAIFEATMQKALDNTPELALFITPFQLTRIAQEDVKLAELMFRQGQKKMLLWKQQTAQQNQEATFKAQHDAAVASEQEKQNTEQIKGQIDLASKKLEGETANKNAVITMVTSLLSKGEAIPPNLMPLVNVVVENMIIPLAAQNEVQKQAIIQQMQQAQQPPQQQGQPQMIPPDQQQIQQQPPQEAA